MSRFSRRQLAHYAVEQLLDSDSPAKLAKHLAASLITNKKASEAEFLLGDIAYELEKRQLLTNADITTATKLNQQLRSELIRALRVVTKTKEVLLEERIDGSVIGGLKIETPLRTFDKTVTRKLQEIKELV